MSANYNEQDHPRDLRGQYTNKPGTNGVSGVNLEDDNAQSDQVHAVITDCLLEGNGTIGSIKDAMEDASGESVEWSDAEESVNSYLDNEITCCQDCSLVLTNDDEDARDSVGNQVDSFSAQHEDGLSVVGTVEGISGSCDCCGRGVNEHSSEAFLTVFSNN